MAAALLPGWSRTGAKGGNTIYQNPAGETVNRRGYDKARAQAGGWKNENEFRAWKRERLQDPEFRNLIANQVKLGNKQSALLAPESPLLAAHKKAFFTADGAPIPIKKISRARGGAWDNYLKALGVSQPKRDYYRSRKAAQRRRSRRRK